MTTRHISVFYPDLNNADFKEVLRGLRMAGADVIHTTLAWSQVEREPGKLDFSPYADIFERFATEGLLFIIAMDSSGRIIVPSTRVITVADDTNLARPNWLANKITPDIFARDFYGEITSELDVHDRQHLPWLYTFYDEALNFLKTTIGRSVLAILPAITMELEIKFSQIGFRWRSFSKTAQMSFSEFLRSRGQPYIDQTLPVVDFNNTLASYVPKVQRHFAAMMQFREMALVSYLSPLCQKIRERGFATIGYFPEVFTYMDAVYASGVVESATSLFDIACFDYNFYNGVTQVRDPWVIAVLINFARHLGYQKIKIGLYVERYRDIATNKLDSSIFMSLRETLEHVQEGEDLFGLEIGGIEVSDLHTIQTCGIRSVSGFEVGGYLPKKCSKPIKVGVLASFDTHYLWHGDFSCNRDHLHDIVKETYRIFELSRDFEVGVLSAREFSAGRQIASGLEAIILPHVLVMSDQLIERLWGAKQAGIRLVQDVGAGNFTPDGEARDLAQLTKLFGLTGMNWQRGAGCFRYGDLDIEVSLDEQRYFSYVRLAVSSGGVIRMPEIGYNDCGLLAECGNALSFGFLPQICTDYPGKLFWETLFLDTIKSFVRPPA